MLTASSSDGKARPYEIMEYPIPFIFVDIAMLLGGLESNGKFVIHIKQCGIEYVGQTVLRLRDRFLLDLPNIDMPNHKSNCIN